LVGEPNVSKHIPFSGVYSSNLICASSICGQKPEWDNYT
jgi:hypothetical protein